MTARYGVYAVPGLGATDSSVPARLKALGEAALARTSEARRYGWHATLKAPFRLADGVMDVDLVKAVDAFAASHGPVIIPAIELRRIAGFWAVVPGAEHTSLLDLAADVVRDLDHLRAPLGEDDAARRRPELLTERQRELLAAWGYPYVLDEFRFHCTLTDHLVEPELSTAEACLATELADVLGNEVALTHLVVTVEPEPGADFLIHSTHPLQLPEEAR